MILGVTGHRPQKLGGFSETTRLNLRAFATTQINKINPELVIIGMALGFDQAVAHACVDCGIPFWAYVPFDGQEVKWPELARKYYYQLLGWAAKVEVVCPGTYAPWKMLKRDDKIVTDSEQMLALWNGLKDGGTWHTVQFATTKVIRPVINCWQDWIEFPKEP